MSSPSRREVLTGAGAAFATSLSFAASPARAAPNSRVVTGFVFDDAYGNGRRLPNSGIARVMVSNGRDVTMTRNDGSWSLAALDSDLIFVVKPSEWTTPLGSGGVPSFARTVGNDSIEFPLRRAEEPTNFEVLLFADTQPSSAIELGYLRDEIIGPALGVPAAFGINHGDVVGDDLTLYGRYLDILGAMRIPWHHCPGNHDMDAGARDNGAAFATWRRMFGPTHYAFEYGPATFVLLNNVDVCSHAGYRGRVGIDQLAFIENVLRNTPEDRLVVVSMHIPLASFDAPHDPRETTSNVRELLEILAKRPNTVSFAGHSHTTEHHYLGRVDGFDRDDPHHHHVLTAASGSWWGGVVDERGIPSAASRDGSPKGFHILSIDGVRYETRFVPVSRTREVTMRIMLSKPSSELERRDGPSGGVLCCPLSASALWSTELVVDVFDGGPRTALTYEIEGANLPPRPMRRSRMADPHIVDVFGRDRHAYKPWVAPAPSSHIWTAALPEDLAPGVYRLVVRGTDEFGRPISDHMVLDVVA